MSTTDLYELDLRRVGVKDRELVRLIDHAKTMRERRAAYFTAAEEARRAAASLPERLREAAAAAITAGEEPKDEARVITETEQAVTIAETRVDAATQAVRDAERAVEAYLTGVAASHRASIRDVTAKDTAAAIEAVDATTAAVDAVLHDLSALLQMQPLPHGSNAARDRRNMGQEYGPQHRVRALLKELRDEVTGLVPPSEEAFAAATEGQPGYLHRPPRDHDRWNGFITSQATSPQHVTGRLS